MTYTGDTGCELGTGEFSFGSRQVIPYTSSELRTARMRIKISERQPPIAGKGALRRYNSAILFLVGLIPGKYRGEIAVSEMIRHQFAQHIAEIGRDG